MRTLKVLIALIMLAVVGWSCNSRDDIDYGLESKDGVGELSINLNAQITTFKSALLKANIDPSTFKVQIFDAENNVVRSFNKYSEMPAQFELKAGSYTVKAFSGDQQEAAFNAPYYVGEKAFAIAKEQTTTVDLTCTMGNMAVTIAYTDLFKTAVKDYTVTVSNGTGNLIYDAEGKIGYFKVAPLTIVLNGKAVLDDSPVTFTHTITSVAAKDFHKVTFDITSDGTGILQKPGIIVDESLNDKNTIITIPGNGGGNTGSAPTIAGVGFNIETPITFIAMSNSYPTVKIDLKADNKIKELKVRIESEKLEPALAFVGIPTEFDIANLSPELRKNFEDINLIKPTDVILGATAYTFDISSFMGLLEAGEHKFHLTIVDEKSNAATKTLVVAPTAN